MKGDAIFFLGIFIFIFIIWVATGGPTRPISFSGPFLTPLTPTGETHGYSISRSDSRGDNFAGGDRTDAAFSESGQSTSRADNETRSPGPYQAFGSPSPERALVNLYRGSYSPEGAAQEYLALKVSSQASAPVVITGWTVESAATGKRVSIPGGTNAPRSGIINRTDPIALNPGDTAYLISGQSPIGASFRTNICSGYFSQFQTFSPPLTDACPEPTDEAERLVPNFNQDDTCRRFLDTVARCTYVTEKPQNLLNGCAQIIDNDLNYNGCVMLHQSDADFYGSRWYIYLGRTTRMWKDRYETIKLLDGNGLTVAMFSY